MTEATQPGLMESSAICASASSHLRSRAQQGAVKLAPRAAALVGLALFLLTMFGCGPYRLVSPYDQVIDEGVTKFHTDVTAFVGKMVTLAGKPEGTYEANKGTYPELAAE